MKRVLILMAAFAVAAVAADIAGTWKATGKGPNGPVERTFVFKVDGHKLTGEVSGLVGGKSTISDGKVDGDNLSFIIAVVTTDTNGGMLLAAQTFKGKVSGADLHLTSKADPDKSGQFVEWTGKKVQ